jgi:hypothetical protein
MTIATEEIDSLAERAMLSGQIALASILYVVCASMEMGDTEDLMRHIRPFMESQINLIDALQAMEARQTGFRPSEF